MRFFPLLPGEPRVILSGAEDKTIRVWRESIALWNDFVTVNILEGINGSINCLAVDQSTGLFASGDANGDLKIWTLNLSEHPTSAALIQSIIISPRLIPLTIAIYPLEAANALALAVGGTSNTIKLYASENSGNSVHFRHIASLTGHEGWIRCLDFVAESSADVLLASSSQDRYIRIWRIRQGEKLPTSKHDALEPSFRHRISNKAHRFDLSGVAYSLTFEALLLGHEDWVYTAHWSDRQGKLQLLSASADNSLAIWEADAASGVWICITRLGELSVQKGSTTATGSSGGFWVGLWSPCGDSLISLGRTGSWRRWLYDESYSEWKQVLGVSGHIKDVRSISWARRSPLLLSTSSDQTTRLHAPWKHGARTSWHEFSRPQIHGYDLNCIDTISTTQFVSGADEKLLRVFDEPRAIANLLHKACGVSRTETNRLPEVASIPVLGLSNKAIDAGDQDGQRLEDRAIAHGETNVPESLNESLLNTDKPPTEDVLARHTLWPEKEKLYGHGYEISALAASHNGELIATACKASSLDHAVIRLYETRHWREIKPSLIAHTLTVTCLRFSDDDSCLLSVGRDRRWTIFKQNSANNTLYETYLTNPKGHARMILGAAWAPGSPGRIFATAARDRLVKLWSLREGNYEECASINFQAAITAVDILASTKLHHMVLAAGLETGGISLHCFNSTDTGMVQSHEIRQR